MTIRPFGSLADLSIPFGAKAQASLDQFSMLPLTNWYSRFLNQKSVNTLWGSMLHPPLSYLGDEHQYRTADGSNNVRNRCPYCFHWVPGF